MPPGEDITIFIECLNNTGYKQKGITNGFYIYSPDGATWGGTVGDTMPDFYGNSWFDIAFGVAHHSCNGSGADTVGFGGAIVSGSGLSVGYDDTAYTITIGPIPSGNIGDDICVDSCWYPPVNRWMWSAGTDGDFLPAWDGPICWTIGGAPITFRGNMYYQDPTPKATGPDTTQVPMSNFVVEMWDRDQNPVDSQLLGAIRMDDSGYFEFNNISNVDENGSGGQDVYFIAKASNLVVGVVQNIAYTVHEWHTATWNDVPSGSYDTVFVCPTDSSGPFFVADAYLDARNAWDSRRPSGQFELGYGFVALAADTIQTGYNATYDYIFINDSSDVAREWPDTWNRWAVHHEYGHRIASNFDFFDDTTGAPASHAIWQIHNLEFAASEGFAQWWSTVVAGTPMRTKYWNDFQDSSWFNLENGEYGRPGLDGSFNARGPECEGAVAGILWDIYDNADDDYSGRADWGLTRLPHTSDGVGDDLYDGSDNILKALLTRDVAWTRLADNIHEFYQAWFDSPDLGSCQFVWDIYYEHGDSIQAPPKGCYCCRMIGDVNNSGAMDISDLVYLVDFMFTGGPEPLCMEQADIDATGVVDIADLVYLVDFMFTGGPWPPACDYK